tara:strand:- start:404 stop:727 length:324 start_codon:yes stop_codon:yes gene_type:complete
MKNKKINLIIASIIIPIIYFYYFIKVGKIDSSEKIKFDFEYGLRYFNSDTLYLSDMNNELLLVAFFSFITIGVYILCYNLFFKKKHRYLGLFIAWFWVIITRMAMIS